MEAFMILSVKTSARTELIDITSRVAELVKKSGVSDGRCMLYVPHTTAAVTINESADPSVKDDILMVLNQIVPWDANYRHGEGNSPAHIKSTLVGASEMVAIENGSLVLGTWQGIFFCEFDGPRTRKVHVRITDERFS
jgi:secondary thiamine-phosphate synthase enzyme